MVSIKEFQPRNLWRKEREATREAISLKLRVYFAIVTANSQFAVHGARSVELVTDDPRGLERVTLVLRDAKRGRAKGLTTGREIRTAIFRQAGAEELARGTEPRG